MISKINKFLKEIPSYPEEFIKINKIKTNIKKSKIIVNDAVFIGLITHLHIFSNIFELLSSFINYNNYEDNNKHKYFS
jgi:hypothetical protein